MTAANRTNRKITDQETVKLNSLGLSLSGIAKRYDCHPTAISTRLKTLNIAPADTRRSFMDKIVNNLTPAQEDLLASKLGPGHSIQDYVNNLILRDLLP